MGEESAHRFCHVFKWVFLFHGVFYVCASFPTHFYCCPCLCLCLGSFVEVRQIGALQTFPLIHYPTFWSSVLQEERTY